jgi:glycosyltransferase involved in cell wall biosynthesis
MRASRRRNVRILQVTSYYAPAWGYGGPPRVMTQYASGLAARGHDVTVFTTDALDDGARARPRRELLDGVDVHRFANLSNTLAWRSKKYLPPGLVFATAARARRYDVVHATDARTVATASAALAARASGAAFCLSAHGSLPGSSGLRGAVKRGYDRALVQPMLAHAALLLAQTEHEADLYLEAGARPEAVELLPLPLDLAAVPVTLEPGFLHRVGAFPPDLPLLLFLGRVHRLKGLDVLVDAVAPLLAAGEAGLAIVGRDDGAWAEIAARYRSLLDAGVLRMLGPLYGPERFHAYADADVFCLTPRHWEETSLASLEAAAVGTPLVVTRQADVPGLADAHAGTVVPLDADAIRAAVRAVLPRARELGENARALVERQHDVQRVVPRLEHLFDRVVR